MADHAHTTTTPTPTRRTLLGTMAAGAELDCAGPPPGMVARRTVEIGRLHMLDARGCFEPSPTIAIRVERFHPAPATETARTRIEDAIEYLIALLDAEDGNPDFELDNEDACSVEDFMHRGDGLPGDRDDEEPDDDDLGANEDEGVRSPANYQGSGAGCPIFDGL